VKRQVQTLKDKIKSLKKRYKYAETPYTKSVVHDIQSDDSGTYIHVPKVVGLVQPNYPDPLVLGSSKSVRKIGLRGDIYDDPVDPKRVCYTNRAIKQPPLLFEELGDGSVRRFDTYCEKDFLRYGRSCTLLEYYMKSACRRLASLATRGAVDVKTKKTCLASLYTVLQTYDPMLGYNQSRPKTWVRRSGKDNTYGNRLLLRVFKGISACHAA